MEIDSSSWVFKILLLGDSAVGKTTMIKRFIEKTFKADYKETLGVNIIRKSVKVEELNAQVSLIIWDIAGQERYEERRKFYYEGCFGALLVYDITRYSSFENIEVKWLRHYKESMEKDVPLILIGNKDDLEDQRFVFQEDAEKMCKKIGAMRFMETSAKTGHKVNSAFLELIKAILDQYKST